MAAGQTYTPIATTTVSSAVQTVTFPSITGSYTDLVIVCANLKNPLADTPYIKFNSDGNANYSTTWINYYNTTADSSRVSNSTGGVVLGAYNVGMSSSVPSNVIINIQNYSNTTNYKSSLIRWNSYNEIYAIVGEWRSTSAITDIDLISGLNGSSRWSVGSSFTLYGIQAA